MVEVSEKILNRYLRPEVVKLFEQLTEGQQRNFVRIFRSVEGMNTNKIPQAIALCERTILRTESEQPPSLNSCPYPYCKGEGKLQQNAGIYYVYCKNCGRHTDSFETEAKAVRVWNSCFLSIPHSQEDDKKENHEKRR